MIFNSEKKYIFDCIFNEEYTPPDFDEVYNKYYCLKNWEWNFEYIFSMTTGNYIGMVKSIDDWKKLSGGWEIYMCGGEPAELDTYILFKGDKRLPFEFTVSPLWTDNTHTMLWSKTEDGEVNIDMDGNVTIIEDENEF